MYFILQIYHAKSFKIRHITSLYFNFSVRYSYNASKTQIPNRFSVLSSYLFSLTSSYNFPTFSCLVLCIHYSVQTGTDVFKMSDLRQTKLFFFNWEKVVHNSANFNLLLCFNQVINNKNTKVWRYPRIWNRHTAIVGHVKFSKNNKRPTFGKRRAFSKATGPGKKPKK